MKGYDLMKMKIITMSILAAMLATTASFAAEHNEDRGRQHNRNSSDEHKAYAKNEKRIEARRKELVAQRRAAERAGNVAEVQRIDEQLRDLGRND